MSSVEGRVVAITGASRGLGAALSIAFAAAGAKLSLCARSLDRLEKVRRSVADYGVPCVVEPVDVAASDAVNRWIELTTQRIGAPEVLINNASVLGARLPLAEFPLPLWREVMEVNITGALAVTQAVLPAMLGRGNGSIINVSSGAASPPRVNWGAYAISKLALEGISQNLARELEGTGIRVNVVDPGAMRTDMRAAAYPEEDPADVKEPGSIAPLFLWLASDDAAGVSGQRFRADEWAGV